jgi:carbon-monoxide dehydrogenase small subunit
MSTHEITLTVNDTEEELTVESRTLLVHALRDQLGYTGPKIGCETSKCGACTVTLDGDAVKACTVLAVQTDGSEVTTVEGLADGDDLDPIQESFHEEHALQCGYCTPGMVMTTRQLLEDDPDPDAEEIRHQLKGNICRCTGYQNIVNAVETAAEKTEGAAESADDAEAESPPAKADGGEGQSGNGGATPRSEDRER